MLFLFRYDSRYQDQSSRYQDRSRYSESPRYNENKYQNGDEHGLHHSNSFTISQQHLQQQQSQFGTSHSTPSASPQHRNVHRQVFIILSQIVKWDKIMPILLLLFIFRDIFVFVCGCVCESVPAFLHDCVVWQFATNLSGHGDHTFVDDFRSLIGIELLFLLCFLLLQEIVYKLFEIILQSFIKLLKRSIP